MCILSTKLGVEDTKCSDIGGEWRAECFNSNICVVRVNIKNNMSFD